MKLRRECRCSGVRSRCTEWIRQSGLAVDGDDWDAQLVFVAVARRLRISAQIIFFQRKVGVGLGKGAARVRYSCHFDTREKKRYIDFGVWGWYYVG